MSMHCPNPDCSYLKRFRTPAEYRDGFQACSDCGSALVAGDAVPLPAAPRPRAGPIRAELLRRLAVTAGALGVAWAARQVQLPGVTLAAFADAGLLDQALPQTSIAGLGLGPALSAFVVVEWAALIVPPWRRLRVGPPEGRLRLLRATAALTLVFGLLQGFGIARWMESVSLLVTPGYASSLLVVAVLAPMSVLALLLAMAVSRWGIGNGFAVLIAATVVPELARGPGWLTIGWAVASYLLFQVFWRHGRAPGGLPLPTSGVAPAVLAHSLLSIPVTLMPLLRWDPARFDELLRSNGAGSIIEAGLILSGCITLSFLFNRPEKVSEVFARLGVKEPQISLVRGAVISSVFLLLSHGAARTGETLASAGAALNVLGVTGLVAVLLDLASEWRFRRAHGGVVPVWQLHQVFAAPAVVEALAAQQIDSLPRALRYRALLQFFGPYVPVEILVPAAQAAAAEAALRASLTPRPAGAPPAR